MENFPGSPKYDAKHWGIDTKRKNKEKPHWNQQVYRVMINHDESRFLVALRVTARAPM